MLYFFIKILTKIFLVKIFIRCLILLIIYPHFNFFSIFPIVRSIRNAYLITYLNIFGCSKIESPLVIVLYQIICFCIMIFQIINISKTITKKRCIQIYSLSLILCRILFIVCLIFISTKNSFIFTQIRSFLFKLFLI